MEVGIRSCIPTYSGGLGVLAGDFLKSAADLGLPVVGVTLLYNGGYFNQRIDEGGRQVEEPVIWPTSEYMRELPHRVKVKIEGRDVSAKGWRFDYKGKRSTIPIYCLDTNGNENAPWDKAITLNLYGGEHPYHRLAQEAVLGIGGVKFLEQLGYTVGTYHMNESHPAFVLNELLRRHAKSGDEKDIKEAVERVREQCVFTTHSVVAGHDRFSYNLINQVFGDTVHPKIKELAAKDGCFDNTQFAMSMSRYVNSVSRRHKEASKKLLNMDTDYITNGVHSYTWTSKPFQDLFDAELPEWREDPAALAYASSIDGSKIAATRRASKRMGADYLFDRTKARLDPDSPVVGDARRFTGYKRMGLLFRDMDRLKRILKANGAQVVFGGKAHPNYREMKDTIAYVNACLRELRQNGINAVFLPNYDMEGCAAMTSMSDVWLNTPRVGEEASGTSGMCAAHNGVPQQSTLDGWWCEGHIEDVTGWSIGGPQSDDKADAEDLYRKLEIILPRIKNGDVADVMVGAISRNASFFNTQRMAREYAAKAYGLNKDDAKETGIKELEKVPA